MNQRKNTLFSETDMKSAEISGYTIDRITPENDQSFYKESIPTGVVDIDESTVLPITPSKFPEQHDSKGYKVIRPRETYNRANIHLPPISNYHSHQRNPYEYHDADANYHHSNYLHHSRSKPNKNQKDQLHLSLDHYHYHHRYRYDRNGETYDPRWWYMPINSVHGPKSYRHIANHYVAPKWYELGSKY